jgi:hypothetical protein
MWKSRTIVIDKEKTVDMSHCGKTGRPPFTTALCLLRFRPRVFSPSFFACKSASVTREAQEPEIERGLLIHLRDLLLELGRDFAFVGSQAHASWFGTHATE